MQDFYYLLRNSPKKTCKLFTLQNLRYKKQSILTFWTELLAKPKRKQNKEKHKPEMHDEIIHMEYKVSCFNPLL